MKHRHAFRLVVEESTWTTSGLHVAEVCACGATTTAAPHVYRRAVTSSVPTSTSA